jgi:hypothetical protein
LLIAQNDPRQRIGGALCGPGFLSLPGPHKPFEEALMEKFVYASGALRKYLHARAKGASQELLSELSAQSLVEQDGPRLRLVVSNSENGGKKETAEPASSPADAADDEDPDLAG